MATFREVRDLLAFACFEDIIDEDEFLLLWELNTSKNLDFPYEDYGRFDLDEMDDSECVAEFRVKKHDLPDLAAALQIPNQFVCHQRSVADGMEGLCMLPPTTFISLQILRHDSALWSAGSCYEHGYKYCAGLYLYHPQSQDTTMEPSYFATGTASNIC